MVHLALEWHYRDYDYGGLVDLKLTLVILPETILMPIHGNGPIHECSMLKTNY